MRFEPELDLFEIHSLSDVHSHMGRHFLAIQKFSLFQTLADPKKQPRRGKREKKKEKKKPVSLKDPRVCTQKKKALFRRSQDDTMDISKVGTPFLVIVWEPTAGGLSPDLPQEFGPSPKKGLEVFFFVLTGHPWV